MACPHCGSWSVKADRSLAGRLVCGRCGRPLGKKEERRSVRRSSRSVQVPWWGWLAALVAVSAGLASLAPPPPLPMPNGSSSPGGSVWR